MRRYGVMLKVTALACVSVMALAGCGSGGASTAEDGRPIVTVQVVKDARAEKMSKMGWTPAGWLPGPFWNRASLPSPVQVISWPWVP